MQIFIMTAMVNHGLSQIFTAVLPFSTERELKQAINRKINRDLESGNLRRHFGTGSRVNVNVYCKELGFTDKPLATTHLNVY